MEVIIQTKEHSKHCNPKTINNLKVLIDAKFIATVKYVLDMQLEVPIPIVISWAFYLVANYFMCDL
jgi:hypothetical protein